MSQREREALQYGRGEVMDVNKMAWYVYACPDCDSYGLELGACPQGSLTTWLKDTSRNCVICGKRMTEEVYKDQPPDLKSRSPR